MREKMTGESLAFCLQFHGDAVATRQFNRFMLSQKMENGLDLFITPEIQ